MQYLHNSLIESPKLLTVLDQPDLLRNKMKISNTEKIEMKNKKKSKGKLLKHEIKLKTRSIERKMKTLVLSIYIFFNKSEKFTC